MHIYFSTSLQQWTFIFQYDIGDACHRRLFEGRHLVFVSRLTACPSDWVNLKPAFLKMAIVAVDQQFLILRFLSSLYQLFEFISPCNKLPLLHPVII